MTNIEGGGPGNPTPDNDETNDVTENSGTVSETFETPDWEKNEEGLKNLSEFLEKINEDPDLKKVYEQSGLDIDNAQRARDELSDRIQTRNSRLEMIKVLRNLSIHIASNERPYLDLTIKRLKEAAEKEEIIPGYIQEDVENTLKGITSDNQEIKESVGSVNESLKEWRKEEGEDEVSALIREINERIGNGNNDLTKSDYDEILSSINEKLEEEVIEPGNKSNLERLRRTVEELRVNAPEDEKPEVTENMYNLAHAMICGMTDPSINREQLGRICGINAEQAEVLSQILIENGVLGNPDESGEMMITGNLDPGIENQLDSIIAKLTGGTGQEWTPEEEQLRENYSAYIERRLQELSGGATTRMGGAEEPQRVEFEIPENPEEDLAFSNYHVNGLREKYLRTKRNQRSWLRKGTEAEVDIEELRESYLSSFQRLIEINVGIMKDEGVSENEISTRVARMLIDETRKRTEEEIEISNDKITGRVLNYIKRGFGLLDRSGLREGSQEDLGMLRQEALENEDLISSDESTRTEAENEASKRMTEALDERLVNQVTHAVNRGKMTKRGEENIANLLIEKHRQFERDIEILLSRGFSFDQARATLLGSSMRYELKDLEEAERLGLARPIKRLIGGVVN